MAVVKADAYGLGAVPVAKKLEEAGCSWFAVTFIEEAVSLREAGIQSPVLVMMPVDPSESLTAVRYGLTVTVTDYAMASEISGILKEKHVTLRVHMKADSGLSRMGIVLKDNMEGAVREALAVSKLPGLRLEAVYTHLTAAGKNPEFPDVDRMEMQRFSTFVERLREKGLLLQTHLLSSSPYDWYPQAGGDYIRAGAILLGLNPDKFKRCRVENCLTLTTKVVSVKWIPADTEISYGPLYKTAERTRIAIVPVGFADGMRRALSNRGEMILHGRKARIIGKICCDHTILDVTDFDEVKTGDTVTIFGRDGAASQTPGDYAALCGASEPEITSVLSARIPRFYL